MIAKQSMNLLTLVYVCILTFSTTNAHPNGNGRMDATRRTKTIDVVLGTLAVETPVPSQIPVETPSFIDIATLTGTPLATGRLTEPTESPTPIVIATWPSPARPTQILPSGISWCGKAADKLRIDTLDIQPWPLVQGQDIVLKSSGRVLEKFKNGTILQISSNWNPLMTLDLCAKLPSMTGLQCSDIPLSPYDIELTFPYPDTLPATPAMQVEVLVLNAPNKQGNRHKMTCLKGIVGVIAGEVEFMTASMTNNGGETSVIASETATFTENIGYTNTAVDETCAIACETDTFTENVGFTYIFVDETSAIDSETATFTENVGSTNIVVDETSAIDSETATFTENVGSTNIVVDETSVIASETDIVVDETIEIAIATQEPATTTRTSSVTCGNDIIGNGHCEFDVCCSRFGYCGVSEDHCSPEECVAGPCWVEDDNDDIIGLD